MQQIYTKNTTELLIIINIDNIYDFYILLYSQFRLSNYELGKRNTQQFGNKSKHVETYVERNKSNVLETAYYEKNVNSLEHNIERKRQKNI